MGDELQIRDRRNPGWYWAYNELIKRDGNALGVNAIAVYNVLSVHANNETGQAYPSIARIGKLCNLSETPVRNALKRLTLAGWIHSEPRKSEDGQTNLSNLYTLLSIPDPTLAIGLPPLKKRGRAANKDKLDSKDKTKVSGADSQDFTHNEMWEAVLYYLFRIVWKKGLVVTPNQQGQANKFAVTFRDDLGATPDSVRAFADWWRSTHPRMDMPLTDKALPMHYAAFQANGATPAPGPRQAVATVLPERTLPQEVGDDN